MLFPRPQNKKIYRRTVASMGTFVTIEAVGYGPGLAETEQVQAAAKRAFEWFYRVEECCTRFDPNSELMRLAPSPGVPVSVSAILFEATQFALAIAEQTGGAFDPTVGHEMEMRGFKQNYITRKLVRTHLETKERVSYRDVCLNP